MKKIFAISVIALSWLSCGKRQNSIERLTMIEFPGGTREVEIIDNGEYQIDGKFVLPKAKINEFSSKNNFEPLEKITSYREQFIKTLSIENTPQIENKEEYQWLEDCNSSNHWRFLLDEHTGELWASVEYPDKDGQAPPCNK